MVVVVVLVGRGVPATRGRGERWILAAMTRCCRRCPASVGALQNTWGQELPTVISVASGFVDVDGAEQSKEGVK